jgi:hypothetical protein
MVVLTTSKVNPTNSGLHDEDDMLSSVCFFCAQRCSSKTFREHLGDMHGGVLCDVLKDVSARMSLLIVILRSRLTRNIQHPDIESIEFPNQMYETSHPV